MIVEIYMFTPLILDLSMILILQQWKITKNLIYELHSDKRTINLNFMDQEKK